MFKVVSGGVSHSRTRVQSLGSFVDLQAVDQVPVLGVSLSSTAKYREMLNSAARNRVGLL